MTRAMASLVLPTIANAINNSISDVYLFPKSADTGGEQRQYSHAVTTKLKSAVLYLFRDEDPTPGVVSQ